MSNEGYPTEGHAASGNLIVVSAPSGAGKSSLVELALKRVDRLRYSISYTTRKARGAEQHGVNYYFVTEDEFVAMRDRGDFLETAKVHGAYYATPASLIKASLAGGEDVILDIDVQGARQIRALLPDAVTVFILPPSREALESRLRLRNLNEVEDLERRLRNAAVEVRLYEDFKYIIVNDSLERASAQLEAIIVAERQRSDRQHNTAKAIIATFGGESLHA